MPPSSLWPHLSPAGTRPADNGVAARPGGRLLGGREAGLEALLPDLGLSSPVCTQQSWDRALSLSVPSHPRALLGGRRDRTASAPWESVSGGSAAPASPASTLVPFPTPMGGSLQTQTRATSRSDPSSLCRPSPPSCCVLSPNHAAGPLCCVACVPVPV